MASQPDRPSADSELREFVRQADRLMRGAMGDASVTAEEMAALRRIANDPQTLLGHHVQDLRRQLDLMWQSHPNIYPSIRADLEESEQV